MKDIDVEIKIVQNALNKAESQCLKRDYEKYLRKLLKKRGVKNGKTAKTNTSKRV